ncbi:hypothetical protein D9M68_755550 [compost metagenome]
MRQRRQLGPDHQARIDRAFQQRFELDVAGGLAQLQLHRRMARPEPPQQVGQDAVVGRADEGQRQRTQFAPRQPLRQPGQRRGIGQHPPHLGQPLRAGRRQRHGAPRAHEQRHAELLLQRLDLLRQRRLRHRQPLRGAAEMQLFRHGDEVTQLTQVQAGS